MCVPAGLTRYLIAFHSTVSWYHILDSTSENVTDMRLAVSRWRSVIENIGLALFTAVNTFFKDIVIVPELFHFFFSLNEVQIGVNLFVKKASALKQDESRKAIRKPPFQHTDICVPFNAGKAAKLTYHTDFQPATRK